MSGEGGGSSGTLPALSGAVATSEAIVPAPSSTGVQISAPLPPADQSRDAHAIMASRRPNSRSKTPQTPLAKGRYETEMLHQLHALHRDGYAPKHIKAKELRIEADWRDTVPEPAGKHISQRATVGANMVYPPMGRSDADNGRALRLARHQANALMMVFEKQMHHHSANASSQAADANSARKLARTGNKQAQKMVPPTFAESWEAAVGALVEARLRFAEAGDEAMVSDLEALVARLHGDRAATRCLEARACGDYGLEARHAAEARQYYKVLADRTNLERNLEPRESARREQDKVSGRKEYCIPIRMPVYFVHTTKPIAFESHLANFKSSVTCTASSIQFPSIYSRFKLLF